MYKHTAHLLLVLIIFNITGCGHKAEERWYTAGGSAAGAVIGAIPGLVVGTIAGFMLGAEYLGRHSSCRLAPAMVGAGIGMGVGGTIGATFGGIGGGYSARSIYRHHAKRQINYAHSWTSPLQGLPATPHEDQQ